jgi:uncharacterized protein (DUF2267 family)
MDVGGSGISNEPDENGDDLMKAREFYEKVAERSMLSKEEATDLTRAVLETLALRLSPGEAHDLAAQLAEPLAEPVEQNAKGPERFRLPELIRRVSARTGLNEAETTAGVRAVLITLREAIDANEFDDVMAQLPNDFAQLLEPAS